MTSNTKFTTNNGKVWYAKPEQEIRSCIGCEAIGTDECNELSENYPCIPNDHIWTLTNPESSSSSSSEEPKYTLEEFRDALTECNIKLTIVDSLKLTNHFNKISDPEYKQYLALKAKFDI